MDNVFNYYTFCNSLDQDPNGIYVSQISNNVTVIRDDLLPFSTRSRYARPVIEHLHKVNDSDKFIYKTRWFDSTQLAISKVCSDLGFELVILSLATDRDTNSFSEISKTFGTKYVYFSDYDSLKDDYDKYIQRQYTEIPVELEHEISKDILTQMIEKIDIDYDEVWLSVEDSSLIPKVFENRGDIFIVSVTDHFPKTDFNCNKIISSFDYRQSCEPYYPPYATNPYVDGKIWIELEKRLNTHKDRKVLVFNKY